MGVSLVYIEKKENKGGGRKRKRKWGKEGKEGEKEQEKGGRGGRKRRKDVKKGRRLLMRHPSAGVR